MRIYLAIYFALIVGAFVAVWSAGMLAWLPPMLVLVTLAVVIGLGVLLAVVTYWRRTSRRGA